MKVAPRILSLAAVLVWSAALAACNGNNSSPPPTYTIGGTVVNLAGTTGGLILQDNLTDNLTVITNGSFTFATPIPSGGSYSVTIFAQPSNPPQTCGVTGGAGTANGNIVTVEVNCGHNEWTWAKGVNAVQRKGVYGMLGIAAIENNPGGRQLPATWIDSSGNPWLFGGYGLDSAGGLFPMNDLWEYSNGEWTWMGGPNIGAQQGVYGSMGAAAASNIPGARYGSASWTDKDGNFWLFGGNGFDSAGNEGYLNDLWKFSAGEWTWIGGSNVVMQPGSYGTLNVPDANNIPGARFEAVTWVDSSGDFWLFGGFGYDSTAHNGLLNDLWKYSGGQWTWVSGAITNNQRGVYGSLGVPAAGNVPGGRTSASGWIDSSGSLWLFGGAAADSTGTQGFENDLWRYSNGEWTWMSGSAVVNQLGVYGLRGMASATNIPGARQNSVSWIDPAGNLWLFGGNAISVPNAGLFNDLWKYSNGEWTWMSGSSSINPTGVYGTQGTPAPGNVPGGRLLSCGWVDLKGNFWLFGGYGYGPANEGDLDDLWMYLP